MNRETNFRVDRGGGSHYRSGGGGGGIVCASQPYKIEKCVSCLFVFFQAEEDFLHSNASYLDDRDTGMPVYRAKFQQ